MSSRIEKLSHYGIVVIAVAAVVVSIWQVRILQDHNKLSVKPLMDFLLVTNADSVLSVSISNRGIGPAIIQDISYVYEDSIHKECFSVLKEANILEKVTTQMNYGKNTVLSPDSEFVILEVKKKDFKPIGISVYIKYESIYEDEFEMDLSF